MRPSFDRFGGMGVMRDRLGYLEPKDREDLCAVEQAANMFISDALLDG
jgi:hypothetical protein